jgi:transposase
MTKHSAQPDETPFVGVDVASKHLDSAVYGSNAVTRCKNTRSGITAWLATLAPGSRIALESTGRYHELLAGLAHAHGFMVYLLNPRDVRQYARAMGMRGKTDRLDAQILARYVAHEHRELRPWEPQPAAQQALDELLRRRAVVVKNQESLKMSSSDSPDFRKIIEPVLDQCSKALGQLDKQIAKAVAVVDAGTGDFACITSVPGIGLLSGAALLGVFRRLAAASSDAVIAFLGLDPRPMDSGQKVGTRRLSKRGPAEWRRLLFNAARSGARTSAWKAQYEHELAKHLPSTAAHNVLARKLVRVAFALFKTHTRFDPSRLAREPRTA